MMTRNINNKVHVMPGNHLEWAMMRGLQGATMAIIMDETKSSLAEPSDGQWMLRGVMSCGGR